MPLSKLTNGSGVVKVLFIGDIVGRPGRQAVSVLASDLRREYGIDFIIANGENAAAGFGITQRLYQQLLTASVDCVTTGNHIWAQKEVETWIGNEVRLLRPANFPTSVPGQGSGVYEWRVGERIAVVNLCGRVFMQPLDCPFRWADRELPALAEEAKIIIIDFHAEATSEKQAFARHVDGRVAAVIGTHTHVQTADEQLLPGGTAYITDCGMTGPVNSVIGTAVEPVVARFLTQMPQRFAVAAGPVELCGVIVEVDERTGLALNITRLKKYIDITEPEAELEQQTLD
ncbi:MAG: TIGR00282 family metallophosphoesterase [Candidatus Zipacnadales bacterium]